MKSFKFQRKIFALIFVLKIFISIKEIEGKKIQCEDFGFNSWYGEGGEVKSCYMRFTTSIDEPGVTISRSDESVRELNFNGNRKIFYLPDNAAGTFPNLKIYEASGCSLKEVSKRNFNGLVKLQFLFLKYNQIEKIASETFEGLTALEQLQMNDNKIKFMNGEAFQGPNKLEGVYLHGNICINDDFNNSTQIAAMPRIVGEKCKFDEQEETTLTAIERPEAEIESLKRQLEASKAEILQVTKTCELNLKAKSQEIQALKAQATRDKSQIESQQQTILNSTNETGNLRNQLEAEKQKKCSNNVTAAAEKCRSDLNVQEILSSKTIEQLKSDKVELKSEVSGLKFEMSALKIECRSDLQTKEQQCKQQVDFSRELHNKLESQWNATCIAETRELRVNFDSKLQENSELLGKLQHKEAEIIDTKEKIENLNKKIEFLIEIDG